MINGGGRWMVDGFRDVGWRGGVVMMMIDIV